nr:MAG TPA: hypothetical protein [Caudoviricetes sp.]DAP25136.1 MAG TPA: hypothetical protein [Caudoviricetes sp.]
MAKFSEIILNGKKDGKTLEEINKELKEAGATFSLKSMSEAEAKAKALKEQEEGFKKGEEPLMVDGVLAIMASDGKPIKMTSGVLAKGTKASVKTPSMERDISRAGTTIEAGGFRLTYDSEGYCKSKARIK